MSCHYWYECMLVLTAVAGVVEHAADEPNPGWARNIRRGLWRSGLLQQALVLFQNIVNAMDANLPPTSNNSEFPSRRSN